MKSTDLSTATGLNDAESAAGADEAARAIAAGEELAQLGARGAPGAQRDRAAEAAAANPSSRPTPARK